ncbi:MAG: hypothetical protein Q9220_002016 [cf. Caloplaca sp. 1 TL-2023]
MLIHFGVVPYLVFDGDYLPSKAATEKERAKKREESRKLGLELHRLGKISQAHLELQKAVDVSPEMARQLIEELKTLGVQYVVAPYEADAQLAYLEKKGVIQGILSEDSDLLVFGAKRLLTKLDQYGDCIEINRSDFTACREISLVGWTDAEFRRMAILSGCDYLASINKMGLKTAYRLVRKYKTIDKILRMLQFDGQFYVPAGYLESFQRAEQTFLHQRVFCPIAEDVVMMTEPEPGMVIEDMHYLGSQVEKTVALSVVNGDLHPMTKQPIAFQNKVSRTPKALSSDVRRQTMGTPSDLKSNKSIDTFFKARRTPLAELDPNRFTPSPSQQRVLQRSSSAWASSPAPAGPSLARSSTAMSLSESRLSKAPASQASFARSIPSPHPPKKRRLCSDLAENEETQHVPSLKTERSRFFASNISTPSPSLTGAKTNKNRKKTDFNIWSDDSIEDAMAELPDMSQTPKPAETTMSLVEEGSQKTDQQYCGMVNRQEDAQPESQCSTASRSTLRTEDSTCTVATSVTQTETAVKVLGASVQSDLISLGKEFLYQPESERCKAQREEITKSSSQPVEKPLLQRRRSMTPLQRIGAAALNRSQSCKSSLNCPAVPQDQTQTQHSSSQLPDLSDALLLSTQSMSKDPPPTIVRAVKGSEDLMVPDSEAESEESQTEDERGKHCLDLGRFTFSG